jgi:hypothetical protein
MGLSKVPTAFSRVCVVMHDSSSDAGDDDPPPNPSESEVQALAGESFHAAEYLHLAEECLLLASLTKDPEKAAELVKAGDDYLRLAAKWLADRLENHRD